MSSTLKDKLNYFKEFKEWYLQIREEFNFDYQRDLEARNLLSEVLKKKNKQWRLDDILKTFSHRILLKPLIIIYGCGPSLEETVNKILTKQGTTFFNKFINLAADGASVFLKEKNIRIEAIFTDLDGITQEEFNYSRFNIIHAHGDNIEKIIQFENEIINFQNVIGTTQVEPVNNILNPGGFTDGDRILFFLRRILNPYQKIYLIGMDFKNIVGRYSKLDFENNQEGSRIKKKKLQIAVELISWVMGKMENELVFIDSENVNSQFNYISLEDFFQIIG
jgi:uncharacterized Rossmann fold enzyme